MTIKASEFAAFLGSSRSGSDIVVNAPTSLRSASVGSLIFANTCSEATRLVIEGLEDVNAFVVEEFRGKIPCS